MNAYHHELASTTTCMRRVRSMRANTQCLESSTLPKGQQTGRRTQPRPRFMLTLIWGRTENRAHVSLLVWRFVSHAQFTTQKRQKMDNIRNIKRVLGIILFCYVSAQLHSSFRCKQVKVVQGPRGHRFGSTSECESPTDVQPETTRWSWNLKLDTFLTFPFAHEEYTKAGWERPKWGQHGFYLWRF